MPNKLLEREHARRMLVEWCTRYMQAGDLQEAALALPLPDGRHLEIGLRMSDPVRERPEKLRSGAAGRSGNAKPPRGPKVEGWRAID